MNFLKQNKITKVKAAAGAGTTDVESDILDMSGFEGVVFTASIATAAAGNYIKVQQGAASNLSDAADLAGTKVVAGDNADSATVEVYRPTKRYVRAVIVRGTSTATGDMYAVQYGPAVAPVTQGATIDSELHLSPAEGTA